MRRPGRIAAIVALALVAAIQLVPYGHRRTNPVAGTEPTWDSPRTRELFFRSCGDCHSNDTRWPWYSCVAPVSWFVIRHVENGRQALNVSRWSDEMTHAAEEAGDEIRHGTMPLASYLRMHHDAKLSEAEKSELARGLQISFRAPPADAFLD